MGFILKAHKTEPGALIKTQCDSHSISRRVCFFKRSVELSVASRSKAELSQTIVKEVKGLRLITLPCCMLANRSSHWTSKCHLIPVALRSFNIWLFP